MNTDAEAKDTKYKTDKEKVSETSKGADKETRKEADTPVKETWRDQGLHLQRCHPVGAAVPARL